METYIMVILPAVDGGIDVNSLHCSWTAETELILNNIREDKQYDGLYVWGFFGFWFYFYKYWLHPLRRQL